ncbi:MAG: hypothetical protein LC737_09715, partial [Chloroflexi bacterium]|nr:hypothetical protein [Chloroflexota bacterium]
MNATCVLVSNPEVALWNAYILNESLYASLVVIAVWFIYRAGERRGLRYLLAGAIVLFAASIRPHGWSLVPSAGVYWFMTRRASGP